MKSGSWASGLLSRDLAPKRWLRREAFANSRIPFLPQDDVGEVGFADDRQGFAVGAPVEVGDQLRGEMGETGDRGSHSGGRQSRGGDHSTARFRRRPRRAFRTTCLSLFGNLYSKGSQSGNDGSPAANLRHHAGVIGPALQELATQTLWQFRLRLSSRADRESIWSCDWRRARGESESARGVLRGRSAAAEMAASFELPALSRPPQASGGAGLQGLRTGCSSATNATR